MKSSEEHAEQVSALIVHRRRRSMMPVTKTSLPSDTNTPEEIRQFLLNAAQ
jgi:hypothetical protein